MKDKMLKKLRGTVCLLLLLIGGGWLAISCSDDDEEEDTTAVWQSRNDAFFASLEDSLRQNPTQWQKFKNFSYNGNVVSQASDYIYVKVLQPGEAPDQHPMYTDSVRVSYQGLLIDGTVFDSTIYNTYNSTTNASVKFAIANLVDGFATALQHMNRKAVWRIYIPYALGYGSTASGSIPAYSTLIFNVTLLDFYRAGHSVPNYTSRRR